MGAHIVLAVMCLIVAKLATSYCLFKTVAYSDEDSLYEMPLEFSVSYESSDTESFDFTISSLSDW